MTDWGMIVVALGIGAAIVLGLPWLEPVIMWLGERYERYIDWCSEIRHRRGWYR
jgi:hypothetical protein